MEKVLEVEIFGKKYKLKSEEKEEYILSLSSYVNKKMEEIAEELKISDPLKVAVLAALSIADEKFQVETQLLNLDEALRRVENSIDNLEISIIGDNLNSKLMENVR